MNIKSLMMLGLLLVGTNTVQAQSTEYERGFNDGFTAGLNRCESPRPPMAAFEARCIAEDTGDGYRYQLRFRDRASETYFTAAVFDREGTYRNNDACLAAIDDLRRTGYRYVCIPVAFNGYGTTYGLSLVRKEGTSFYMNILKKFDSSMTETNLRDCRAQLAPQ